MPTLRQLGQNFGLSEAIGGTTAATKAVFGLAQTISEQAEDSERIKGLAAKIPTLLEALNSPLGQVVNSAVPFLPIATTLIKFFIDANQKEPTIAEIIAIAIQAAYLESISQTLNQEDLDSSDATASDNLRKKITELGDLEINDYEARRALVYFPASKLASKFNQVLEEKLINSGLEQSKAKVEVKKVATNTTQYIEIVLSQLGAQVKELLEWYKIGGKEKFEKYESIKIYLEKKIKPLPHEKVFKEKFSFQDIYVPLKAKSLTLEGMEISSAEEFILEDWVQETITTEDKKDKVIFIQAGAGRGKTVFCRMFADWARRNLHPLLTPIFIRLRKIENYGQSFEETISNALSARFVKSDPAWLADPDTRYLFLLDGFDELRIEGRATGGISRFIRQVGLFQKENIDKENGHRIIMTGRPLALQGITDLPRNLERVKLLPMDEDIQEQWFDNWQNVLSFDDHFAADEVKKLKNFLHSDACPYEVEYNLAKEPLLLSLIAKLHRKGEIKEEDFEITKSRIESKILIYEKSLECVLKEQRDEWLQQNITGLTTENLERILMEAGLSVIQSGGEYAKVKMIEDRLDKDYSEAANTLRKLRKQSGEKAITTALGAFYLRPAAGKTGGGVEFYHKSFSEFLCAKRLQMSIEEWTELRRKYKKLVVEDKELAEQIYDLLGYGGLTPEIVEYLMGLLNKSDEFQPVKLFERLEDFYFRWCDGEFIDAKGITLPQRKMSELEEQVPERETYLGQRQVDVYAGLNIMILLLELYRYGLSQAEETKEQLTFYPCGKPNDNNELEDSTLLLRLIGYSDCIGTGGFTDTVGRFLSGANLEAANLEAANLASANLEAANLEAANLESANLEAANLEAANLESANLASANLESANLASANLEAANLILAKLILAKLRGANLILANLEAANLNFANLNGANLSDANLIFANLSTANLNGANLSNANLNSAYLSCAYLSGANLSGANLNDANFYGIKGLEYALNVPESVKEQLSLN